MQNQNTMNTCTFDNKSPEGRDAEPQPYHDVAGKRHSRDSFEIQDLRVPNPDIGLDEFRRLLVQPRRKKLLENKED